MPTEPTEARPFYVESRTAPDKPWIPFSTYAQKGNAVKRLDGFDLLGVEARILVKCPVCNDTHEVDQCLI